MPHYPFLRNGSWHRDLLDVRLAKIGRVSALLVFLLSLVGGSATQRSGG